MLCVERREDVDHQRGQSELVLRPCEDHDDKGHRGMTGFIVDADSPASP